MITRRPKSATRLDGASSGRAHDKLLQAVKHTYVQIHRRYCMAEAT